ncbi:MAG: AmmeMemoRadiSam system radical SAM enzyme [bacterium]|nr:AmmeMemoRadiSam system radical SAM enzyme [bacterium]
MRAGLSLRVAEYWESVGDGRVRGGLCPRRCVVREGFRGACGVRMNIGGKLRTLVYGKVVAVHVDPIEKKPLMHVLPGSRSFSIATAGCNLQCVFCQNWQISQAAPETAPHMDFSPERIVRAAMESGARSIAYTYTEPTVYFELMRDTARLAREQGLLNVWVTCGYIEEAPLRELCKYIDAANVDLKGFSERFYGTYTTGTLEPVLRTFKILKEEGVWTELTNLIIPGANDRPEDISNLCAWVVTEIGRDMPVHFSRFYPAFKLQDRPPTPVATVLGAVEIAKGYGIKFVYAGNIAGNPYEDTECPGCGKVVIARQGYWVKAMKVRDGRCGYCGSELPGIWK